MRGRNFAGALAGLLSAALALGVGEFAAVFVRPAAAPIVAVGNRIIVLTPEAIKRAVIDRVGTQDKLVLLAGVYVVLGMFAAATGIVAARRIDAGLGMIVLLGGFGCYCALTANGSRASDVVPTLVGMAAALLALPILVKLAVDRPSGGSQPAIGTHRRRFLLGAAATAAIAALGGFGGRALENRRFSVAGKRRAVILPPVKTPSTPSATPSAAPTSSGPPPAADGPDLRVSGIPWATPNARFYRIDTALTVPQVDPDTWTLRVHGMVQHEITLSWQQLLARPMIERWITLCCVSNPVGGDLVGNALWQGAPLADLLREAQLDPRADQLLLTSVDGYSFGAPTDVVMDGRDALLAIGMNREPLPIEHGFPVRTVVPGLYGYVSACKWIIDIEATTFARASGYWVQGGWAAKSPIRLASRIDIPSDGQAVRAGRSTPIAGVAWDQHVGVSRIDVQVNDDPWQPARLASVPSTDTWRQWVLPWTPTKSGSYRLRVRAVDGTGQPQDATTHDPFPSGATGLHTVTVGVTA